MMMMMIMKGIVTKKLQMLLKKVLQLVTFQEGILFNKVGRKMSISYCTAEVMNNLNGQKCEIRHFKRLENTIFFLLESFRWAIECKLNTLRTGLLNCLNARSRGLIQSEVRFL